MKLDPQDLYVPDYVKEEISRCREALAGEVGLYETGLFVDTNNVMYRLAFAAAKDISTPKEMLAVFQDRITKVAGEISAGIVICGIDSGVSLRRSMFGGAPKPEKTPEQEAVIKLARAAIHLLQTDPGMYNPVWGDGYEADDILAGFVVSGLCVHNVIYSTDSDLYQMTNGAGVVQLSPANGTFLKSPIPPEFVPGVKALAGDVSDSVIGIPNVGPVTAMKIMTGEKTIDLPIEEVRRIRLNLTLVTLPMAGTFRVMEDPWFTSWMDTPDTLDDDDDADLPF